MNKILKKYPFPISGLILGMFALGNLLQSYGEVIRAGIGIVAWIMLILLVVKITISKDEFVEAMKNPVIAGTMATFPMALMVGSVYISNYFKLPQIGQLVWFIGLILQILIILYFTKTFVLNFKIQTVFPTWFVVFVGIAVATLTAGAYKQVAIGKISFWFALISYLVLLPIVAYRVIKVKNIPEPALPTLVIFAAPGSLLLAAYMTPIFKEKNTIMVYLLLILSRVLYLYGILLMVKLVNLKFYPSFSAFTFPIVISVMAKKLFTKFTIESGKIPFSLLLDKVEEIIAVLVIIFVFAKYMEFIFGDKK